MAYLPTFTFKPIAYGLKFLFTLRQPRFKTSEDEVIQLESRDPGRTIQAHIYRSNSASTPGPVLLNFHGSGFMFPLHGSDDEYCRFVADNTDYTVLDIAYRLAPQDPYPAALNDVEDAVNWVLKQPEVFDLDKVSAGGFSAGGNLALAAAGSTFPKGTFHSLITFYPPTDLSTDAGSKIAPDATGKTIPPWLARIFDRSYVPAGVDPADPGISPSFIAAENFPEKLLMVTASYDYLATEAEALAEKIRALPNKSVVIHRCEKCKHAFDKETQVGSIEEKEKKDTYALAVEILKQ